MVAAFSQRDPRWASYPLGTGTQTIGEAGCLISCIASILVDWGLDTDIGRLNAWLRTSGGYAKGNLFVWRSVKPLGARLSQLVNCATRPAPMDLAEDWLSYGGAVIALVDSQPGGAVQSHYVRVLDAPLGKTSILDPWQLPGQELTLLEAHYCKPGWDAARAILAMALYERAQPATGPTQKPVSAPG